MSVSLKDFVAYGGSDYLGGGYSFKVNMCGVTSPTIREPLSRLWSAVRRELSYRLTLSFKAVR